MTDGKGEGTMFKRIGNVLLMLALVVAQSAVLAPYEASRAIAAENVLILNPSFEEDLDDWETMVIQTLGLIDSFWVLILPGAVNVWLTILLLNFFRGVPKELEEAALIDGAGHLRTLFVIYLPISLPAIATLAVFSMVFHWNSWFDGLLYIHSPKKYPLATYLQTVIVQRDLSSMSISPEELRLLSQKTVTSAQIFIGALPVLLVYPFLQKYFVKGLVLGSVKE